MWNRISPLASFVGALVAFAIGLLPHATLAKGDLPQPVVKALAKQRLAASGLSVFVQELGAAKPTLAVNADLLRQPASTIKLVTTYAALELLGPAYTWRTEAYLGGPLAQGRLRGDLILKGYGDPFLTPEYFWKFLRGLRDRGIEQIDGNLILDNSHFNSASLANANFDDTPRRAYNALPSALMLNFQAVGFLFLPRPSEQRVDILTNPRPATLRIDNQLRLVNGKCRNRSLDLAVNPIAEGTRVTVSGRYPSGCGEHLLHRVIMPPGDLLFGVFKTVWRELGGGFDGALGAAVAPAGSRPFFQLDSRPLAELIRGINKFSNNVMTRQLLLTVGAEHSGVPGTERKGIDAIQNLLRRNGLKLPGLIIENGSGLSRRTRISARGMGRILALAHASTYAPELAASLPLAAIDGTLRNRFRGEPLAGRLRLKTGSIKGVRAIAGYVTSRSDRTYVIVMLHNQPGIEKGGGVRVQNAMLRWLYEQ